jgi:hypothetical protein
MPSTSPPLARASSVAVLICVIEFRKPKNWVAAFPGIRLCRPFGACVAKTSPRPYSLVRHLGGELLPVAQAADPLGQLGEELHEPAERGAPVAGEVLQGLPEHGLPLPEPPWRELCTGRHARDGRVDRHPELVRVVEHRPELRQRLEREWSALRPAGGPDRHIGVRQVRPRLGGVALGGRS